MTDYLAHIRRDGHYGTVCGGPWQGWQEPDGRTPLDPAPVGPHAEPVPHETQIRLCSGCQRAVMPWLFSGRA